VDVTIQEHKFSIAAEYDIETPNGLIYARKAFFSIPAKIELKAARKDGPTIATLQGHISPLHHRYDFEFADGRTYAFACEKLLKQVYTCERDDERYRLVEHRGLRWSIFQDERQIAAVTKNRLVLGNGNLYSIQMNHNADAAVIACMVIAINTADGDDERQNSGTLDLGNVGPQERPFDESWAPS